MAYPQYGGEKYANLEAEARRRKAGAWKGDFQPPWEWRRQQTADERHGIVPAEQSSSSSDRADSTCTIKGNVNARGERIYHLPNGPYYDQVVIKPEQGDTWFCTEEEAAKQGFRPILRS